MNLQFTPVSGKQGVRLFLPNDCVIKETKDVALKKGSKGKVLPLQNKTEDGYDSHAAKSFEKQNAGGQSKMIEKESAMWKDAAMKLNQKITQLKANHNEHKVATSDAITKLQEGENEIEKKFMTLEEIIQQNASNIQMMNSALTDFHKSNLELKASNAYLQDQLSLTQQQLLGLQSMIFISKGWLVSHDQFVIGKEIGRGAWATVHEATFRGATVAAKCLHTLLITNPVATQLFQRVMEMAFTCQHQNIVTFLGSTLEGPPVILMELMDTSLRSAYELGIVKDNQIHGILHDVAKALHFLHTRPDPVIHRDVSSANVLLKVLYNSEWLAKLGDLGSAKIQQQVATGGPGAIVYSAPEAGDYTKQSPKMDVYSFGIVFIETLTKTHPFQMVDTLKAQVQQHYPQYDQLVTSCTKQQSSDRPKMHDVLTQLDGIGAAKQSLVADFV